MTSVLFSLNIFAQNSNDTLNINLESINITAQRAKLYSSKARLLTIIDRQTIRQMPVNNIDELLESISGVDIRNRGVGGTQADISIRGGSFDQVLILLNGVNITDSQTGHYNLDIPVELSDVVRIELLQGSAARIYGPNAFSGAINIVTEKKENTSLKVETGGGSYNTFKENISAGLGNDKIQTFTSLTHKSSNGYIDNTDYDIKNIFSQTTLTTEKNGKFDLQLAYQKKDYGANGFYSLAYPSQFDHTETVYGALDWYLTLGDKLSINSQIYSRMHYDRFELFRDMENAASWYTSHNYHLSNINGGKVSACITDSWGKITAGLDIRNEHIYSTVLGTTLDNPVKNIFEDSIKFTLSDNRFLPTAFADYSLSTGKFFVSAGIATTNSTQFGTFSSGGTDISYNPTEKWSIFISANSAIRLPTFTDLYYKSATQLANPNLQPEKAQTIEFGSKYNNNNFNINGSVFYRQGKNIIDWVKKLDSTIWQSKNLTKVNALGMDINTQYQFKNFFIRKLNLSYSYLTLDKNANDFDSKYALDYLREKILLSIDHKIAGKLSANWKLGYYDRAGNYSDFSTGNLQEYKPYFMADVRLQWTANKYDIYLDINNLGNIKYADYGGLAQPRRNFFGGIRMKL